MPEGLDAILSQVVWVILPLITYLSSYEDVSWDEPLTIPAGLDAILSQVVWVILPLTTYLVSYEDVNWDEPDITPVGNWDEPLHTPLPLNICAEPLTTPSPPANKILLSEPDFPAIQ